MDVAVYRSCRPHLQVVVEKPKDILKFTNEYLNPFTEAFESILDSKFKIHNYKNHSLDESSDRTGWTGTLWRLGHTKCIGHASQLDNERVVIKWKEDGESIFRKFFWIYNFAIWRNNNL